MVHEDIKVNKREQMKKAESSARREGVGGESEQADRKETGGRRKQ